MLLNKKIIIFDFDGVIVESNHIKEQVFESIFRRYPEQYDALMNYHHTYVSVSRYAKFDYLLQQVNRPGDEILKRQLLTDFSDTTLQLMKTVAFVKGAKEFLETFYNELPLYLASVTPQQDLDLVLENLKIRKYFKDVYGCPPWAKPDAVKDILKKENAAANDVVLIGDSYGDQQAAAQTGIHFIGRNSGLLFEDPQPGCIIEDLTQLSSVLQKTA